MPMVLLHRPLGRLVSSPRRRSPWFVVAAMRSSRAANLDREIIILCVRWYVTYKLSYRDLAAVMLECGIRVAPSTIFRWVQRYVPEFEEALGSILPPGRLFLAR